MKKPATKKSQKSKIQWDRSTAYQWKHSTAAYSNGCFDITVEIRPIADYFAGKHGEAKLCVPPPPEDSSEKDEEETQ